MVLMHVQMRARFRNICLGQLFRAVSRDHFKRVLEKGFRGLVKVSERTVERPQGLGAGRTAKVARLTGDTQGLWMETVGDLSRGAKW
jgi:hypothetical protein